MGKTFATGFAEKRAWAERQSQLELKILGTTFMEWEKNREMRHKDLNNGLNWDDLSYIFGSDSFKEIRYSILFGHESSSSVRQIYERWFELRKIELRRKITTENYLFEQSDLLKELEEGKNLGLDSQYMEKIWAKIQNVASWRELISLVGVSALGSFF